MSPVDPNAVLMTGENSFIGLSSDGGKTQPASVSHWDGLRRPRGAGHALFMPRTVTDGRVRVYGDNIAVARWRQSSIETLLFPAFADPTLPVSSAAFERFGCHDTTATE